MVPQNNYRVILMIIHLITNHHNKYKNEKVWNTARITKMWHRDMKWGDAIGKMVPIDLPEAALPQMFNLFKKKVQYLGKCNEAQCKKMRCTCTSAGCSDWLRLWIVLLEKSWGELMILYGKGLVSGLVSGRDSLTFNEDVALLQCKVPQSETAFTAMLLWDRATWLVCISRRRAEMCIISRSKWLKSRKLSIFLFTSSKALLAVGDTRQKNSGSLNHCLQDCLPVHQAEWAWIALGHWDWSYFH